MNINIESYENYILSSTGTKDISIRSKIPRDDYQMFLAFGTLVPKMAKLSHVLFPKSKKAFEILCELSDYHLGLWGTEPYYNANGEIYFHEKDIMPFEDFVLWEHPQNQSLIKNMKGLGLGPEMYISTRTSIATLKNTMFFQIEVGDYDTFYEMLVKIIDELCWACVVLPPEEIFHNLLVVSSSYKSFLDKFIDRMSAEKLEVLPLKKKENYYSWPFFLYGMN
jgi:hypothetical protein